MVNLTNHEPNKKLPPLRQGVSYFKGDFDTEGKPQWLVHDSGRNKFFIIGWMEYEIIQHWYLADIDLLVNTVNKMTTLNIDNKDVESVLGFLVHNYLIAQSGYQIYKSAKEQKIFKKDNLFSWLISYYLFFKIPLLRPDKFLTRTRRFGEFLFSKPLAFIMSVLAIIALYQLSTRWEIFTHTFSSVFTWQGLFLYALVYTFCKLFHELGHAYMCKKFGVPVPSLGVAFLVFWPVLYTDTTLSWSLKSQKRMLVALGGMWIETYITIFALLIWCNSNDVTIQTIAYITVAVNWVASLLVNVSPFMRFDGYYVFADYLQIPNLQPRAFALTRWQIRRWLFNWPDSRPEQFSTKMHYLLVGYSIFTWIYRLTLYLGIAVLVYHFFIKIVGILLFAIELYYFILGPFVNEAMLWHASKEKFSFNLRTRTTLFLTCLCLLFFFIPITETVKIPGTMGYAHQFLLAPVDSVLVSKLPAKGTLVKANQVIVQLTSLELEDSILELYLNYKMKLQELRRSAINSNFSASNNIIISDINKQKSEYSKLIQLRSQLMLKVPFNGIVMEMAYDYQPGTIFMKDAWIGDIVNPNIIEGEAFVSQMDVNQIKQGMHGYFYPADLGDKAIPIKVSLIEVLNSPKLSCNYAAQVSQDTQEGVIERPCFNSTELGGEIPTQMSEQGEYIPINTIFRVVLTTDKSINLDRIQRGTFAIQTSGMSFASRVFYDFKTLWIKQSGF